MEDFNRYIKQTFSCVGELHRKGLPFSILSEKSTKEHRILVGEGVGDGIVLKSETALELGGPVAGSFAFTLPTADESLIEDNRITLLGDDIHPCSKPLFFGQIVIVSGEDFSNDEFLKLARIHRKNGYIAGYMVKSKGQDIWARVSNSLAEKSFDFRCLGNILIKMVKDISPAVKKAEVIFITSSKENTTGMQDISDSLKNFYQRVKENKWADKGVNIYDCAFHGNCDSCSEKNVCNEITKMANKIRKTG